ncbi:MAG: M14 family metallopeptidase, partial [Pyrinomonadaceae bacterium]
MPLLIAAKDNAFSPELAKKQGKAVVLIQACIHAGESDGKDAGLALFRDIAITKTRLNLIDNVVILFIPIYNPDGHEIFSPYNRINQNGPDEMGFRATSVNLNLNRDYMKLDAPETRAFVRLWNLWKPDFFIDSHVTDGADYQYNITYEFPHFQEIAESLRLWMLNHFEKKVVPEIEKEGNLVTRYIELKGREIKDGIVTFVATPRFSTGYAALRNRPSLLIESHSLKPYKSRARGTYDVFWKTLEEINRSRESLFDAIKQADLETINRGKIYNPETRFPLKLEITEESEPFVFKAVEYTIEDSPISGAKKIVYGTNPVEIVVPKFDKAKVTAATTPPLFYIIPPQWTNVIEVLQAHGVELYRLSKPISIEVESYRLIEPRWAQRPFEGRLMVSYKVLPIKETRFFPANSVIVPLAQELGNVIIHLLEPESPDSLVAWGFFNSIFEQKEFYSDHIMEKLALEMLKNDENLRKEFEERLKTDESFRQNPRARLNFFYERSPYFDKRIGLYPVGRIVKP